MGRPQAQKQVGRQRQGIWMSLQGWKDTSKELVILVTEEIRVQWGLGERYISIPHLSVSTESSTVCLSHKLVG